MLHSVRLVAALCLALALPGLAAAQDYKKWYLAEGSTGFFEQEILIGNPNGAEATVQVSRFGMIVKSPNGYPMLSPFLSVIKAALAQMKGFMVEFGMTPSSRSRISTARHEEEDAEAKRFFG